VYKLALDREYKFDYDLPPILFAFLIVRLLPLVKPLKLWRSGLILAQENNRAQVELDSTSLTFKISIRGDKPA